MQPVRQPSQLVDQAMPEANMGMSEQIPHFPQLGHHMPHSGLVLPAPRAVLPGRYVPNMGAPMQPPFYTYQQMWVPVLVHPLGSTQHHTMSAWLPSRADATTDWKEYTTAEGRKYYHNKVTGKSEWTIPEELKIARELAEKASNEDAQTTVGWRSVIVAH